MDGAWASYALCVDRLGVFNLALGYVRHEANGVETELQLKSATNESPARIAELPFVKRSPEHV